MEKPKILVADDDIDIVESITDFLRKDYKVIPAFDGEEAMMKLEENHDIDLLLLDIMMPKMDGYQVLSELKNKDLPVLVLSAKKEVVDQIKGLSLGAWEYITKPFEKSVLMSQIRTLIKLGQTMKELKKKSEMEKFGRQMAESLTEKLEKELISAKTQLLDTKKNIDNYKLGKIEHTKEDLFEDIVESQKSILHLLNTQLQELKTLIAFYLPEADQYGVNEQINASQNLIDDLFELSESLQFYKH